MKKIKYKPLLNSINNNPMNINIELNINSPLIAHPKPQIPNQLHIHNLLQNASHSEKEEGTRKAKKRKVAFEMDGHLTNKCSHAPGALNHKETLDYPPQTTNKPRQYSNATQCKAQNTQGILPTQALSFIKTSNAHPTNQLQQVSLSHHRDHADNPNLISSSNKPNNKSKIFEKTKNYKKNLSLTGYKYKPDLKSKHSKHYSQSHCKDLTQTHERHSSLNLETISMQKRPSKVGRKAVDGGIKEQQQNLKSKLQKFKLDILKLGGIYEQSSIYKSRASNQNIALTPAYKQPSFRHEIDEEQKIREMVAFQNRYQAQSSTDKIVNQWVVPHQQTIHTSQLIRYYSQSHDNNHSPPQFNLLSSIQPVEISPSFSQEPNHSQEHPPKHQRKSNSLDEFMTYLMKKDTASSKATCELLSLYIEQFKQREKKCLPTQQEKNEGHNYPNNILEEDMEINKQLQLVLSTKAKLLKQLKLSNDKLESIEDWEYRYRRDLLKLKRKMWAEYDAIKHIIPHHKQKDKQKSQHHLMKCLSQNYISSQLERKEQHLISESSEEESLLQLKTIENPSANSLAAHKQQDYLPTVLHQQLSEINDSSDEDLLQSPNFYPIINRLQKEQQIPHIIKIEGEQTFEENNRITQTQKQDIFQLIFLDLILELFKEAEQRAKLTKPNDKTLAALNRIKKAINSYNSNQKYTHSQKKIGFATNSVAVDAIASKLCDLLEMDIYINDCPLTIRQSILKNLNAPIGPSDIQLIKSLHYDIFQDSLILTSTFEQLQQRQILNTQFFLEFEHNVIKIKELAFEKYYSDHHKQIERVHFLRNAVHIHHKAIFDCFNEILDEQRCFGIWGKPFPWKSKSLFKQEIYDCQITKILDHCKQNIANNCKYSCGILVDKQQSLVKDYESQPELISQIRQERAHRMLENYNDELDSRWYFIDDDEAEICLQLAHSIWRALIHEVINDISNTQP